MRVPVLSYFGLALTLSLLVDMFSRPVLHPRPICNRLLLHGKEHHKGETKMSKLSTLNRLLRRVGLVIVPVPPSAKMLHEHANVSESFHPSRGGRTVEWMRAVAEATK